MHIEILFFTALILLILEAMIPTMGALGFAGFIAYIYAVFLLITSGANEFYGLAIVNIIILGFVFFVAFGIFVFFLYHNRRKKIETGIEYLIGKTALIESWDNGNGKVFVDGEDWRAIGPKDLNVGDNVTIVEYKKLTLIIEKK